MMVRVKVSRGIVPFSPMGIDSADTSKTPNGVIRMEKSHLLPNNPARQYVVPLHLCAVPIEEASPYQQRQPSVPIEAALCTKRGRNARYATVLSFMKSQQ
jgi:hypothetical protein